MIGPKGATIVFFRSADWCPPCKAHLIELQGHLDKLRRDGMTVFAVSRDSQAILAEFVKRYGITFPLLSDTDSTVIKRFGVLDANGWVDTPRFGVPYRGTITVNHQGVVTSTFFQKTWQEHLTMASVLLRLGKGVDVPATKINAPYLRLTSFTSDQTVTPGAHFMTVLDLSPASGIHVYAPGAAQYLRLKLTIHPRPGLVVKNAQFPTSEDYFFKPLKEHVPVYQRPFRITQELMVDPSPAGQKVLQGATSIKVEGTLEYQVCSDQECFPPQRLPLSWSVNIEPLDDTRIVPATQADVRAGTDRRERTWRGSKYFHDRLSIETHMGMAVDIDTTFRALADPTRRRAIERLCAGPASMTELSRPFRITLPSLSKHLDILEASGIVGSTKAGRVRTYRLVPGSWPSPNTGWRSSERCGSGVSTSWITI